MEISFFYKYFIFYDEVGRIVPRQKQGWGGEWVPSSPR